MKMFGNNGKQTDENIIQDISKLIKTVKKKKILIVLYTLLAICVLFIIVIITPLIALGIIDVGDISSGGSGIGYTDVDTTNTFVWPVGSNEVENSGNTSYALGDPASIKISSYFGTRANPFTGEPGSYHGGMDISGNGAKPGELNVVAAKDGVVTYPYLVSVIDCPSDGSDLDCGGGYGNFVMIKHDDGTETVYAHLYENSITVSAGYPVKAGEVIGKMGNSGQSTGTHLHFEVRANGVRVDPSNYISVENPRPKKHTSSYVEGNENTQTVCLTLKNAGYSDVAVAAMMGNIKMESGFDPSSVNYINCIGLVQWCYGRANNLKNTYGEEWDVISNQLEFILYELNNSESAAKKYLTDDSIEVRTMASKFCNGYERPGSSVCAQTDPNHDRMGAAETLLPYVQNGCN